MKTTIKQQLLFAALLSIGMGQTILSMEDINEAGATDSSDLEESRIGLAALKREDNNSYDEAISSCPMNTGSDHDNKTEDKLRKAKKKFDQLNSELAKTSKDINLKDVNETLAQQRLLLQFLLFNTHSEHQGKYFPFVIQAANQIIQNGSKIIDVYTALLEEQTKHLREKQTQK